MASKVNASLDYAQSLINNTSKPKPESRGLFDIDFKRDPGLVFVLMASLFASVWLFYITFFHSRLLGLIITRLVNKFFIKNGYFKIGESISICHCRESY